MTDRDLAVLTEAAASKPRTIELVVKACAYSCCGRGWRRRDGHEQTYHGYVDNFKPPQREGEEGTFMLYALGLGTISYVVAVRFSEVEMVEWTA